MFSVSEKKRIILPKLISAGLTLSMMRLGGGRCNFGINRRTNFGRTNFALLGRLGANLTN